MNWNGLNLNGGLRGRFLLSCGSPPHFLGLNLRLPLPFFFGATAQQQDLIVSPPPFFAFARLASQKAPLLFGTLLNRALLLCLNLLRRRLRKHTKGRNGQERD